MTTRGPFQRVALPKGGHAIRHLPSGETMHPGEGPWAEANALYVDGLGLREALAADGPPLRVLDVGLGAGANAGALLHAAGLHAAGLHAAGEAAGRALVLTSLEHDLDALRLALDEPQHFPFLAPLAPLVTALLAQGEVRRGRLWWRLLEGDALQTLAQVPPGLDAILFDPFSPKTNPTLWSEPFFARLRAAAGDGEGRLATYSTATPVRAALLAAGWYVGSGPAIGTRQETTHAATRRTALTQPLGARFLERWRRSPWREALGPETDRKLCSHPQFAAG